MTNKKHAKLSASGSGTWMNCPGSVLAQELVPEKDSSIYAQEGTLAHELADLCLKNSKDCESYIDKEIEYEKGAKGLITKDMASSVQEYVDYVRSFETNDSKLYTEEVVDFSHVVPDGFGTSDSAVIDYTTGVCHIFDLKYGFTEVSAIENTQAQLYALGFYNELEFTSEIESFMLHIVQPRINNFSSWELSLEDLKLFSDEAGKKAKLALSPNPERIPGTVQCKWCDARATCESLDKYTNDLLTGAFDKSDQEKEPKKKLDSETSSRLANVLNNKPLIELYIKSIEEYVVEKLENGEDFEGFKLVAGKSTSKWSEEANEFLEKHLGDDAYNKKLLGITDARKILKKTLKKGELDAIIIKSPGRNKLVNSEDKRESITPSIKKFDKI